MNGLHSYVPPIYRQKYHAYHLSRQFHQNVQDSDRLRPVHMRYTGAAMPSWCRSDGTVEQESGWLPEPGRRPPVDGRRRSPVDETAHEKPHRRLLHRGGGEPAQRDDRFELGAVFPG